MQLSRYLGIYAAKNPRSVILYSTKNAAIVELPKKIADKLPDVDLSGEDRKTLISDGFLVRDPEMEKREFLHYVDELNALNRSLSIKLVVNLDCNLACRYCFEGSRKGKHYMTRQTADDFIRFVKKTISSQEDIREILITYYGGEPLLSKELIISISERLKSFARDRGLRLKLFLMTNGTLLTKETVRRMKPLGLKEACITLDGPAHIHNSFRPFKNGSGSFDMILKNIRDVRKQVAIVLNGNFVRQNFKRFPALLDHLRDDGIDISGLRSVQFSPVVAESAEFGPAGFHEGCASVNEPWFFRASVWLREEILKRGGRQARTAPGLCMMEYKNNMLVNYDGGIYKCPGFIGREAYKIGDIKIEMKDYRESHNLDNWKNEECLDCAYLPLCFGGCRYMKLIRDGNMNGVDCKKPFFDACLETLVKPLLNRISGMD